MNLTLTYTLALQSSCEFLSCGTPNDECAWSEWIETGRYTIPTPTPMEERVCDLCGVLALKMKNTS